MTNRRGPLRIIVLANLDKAPVREALTEFRPWLAERARIVAQPDLRLLSDKQVAALPKADLALVLGGDGTLLSQARKVCDLDIPILGINFGKLGFLAEFSLDDVRRHWGEIEAGRCRTSRRILIDVTLHDAPPGARRPRRPRRPPNPRSGLGVPAPVDHADTPDGPVVFHSVALNDAVLNAGRPFRMIEMVLTIDPRPPHAEPTVFSGDGVIVATPSGSTAYNLAAGGPIVNPDLEALCVTPICPHSLAFRPIIVSASSSIAIRISDANPGSALVIDGQLPVKVKTGQRVRIKRHHREVELIHNPELSYWTMLARKLHWAARPRHV